VSPGARKSGTRLPAQALQRRARSSRSGLALGNGRGCRPKGRRYKMAPLRRAGLPAVGKLPHSKGTLRLRGRAKARPCRGVEQKQIPRCACPAAGRPCRYKDEEPAGGRPARAGAPSKRLRIEVCQQNTSKKGTIYRAPTTSAVPNLAMHFWHNDIRTSA
jgi:hypothetical protein